MIQILMKLASKVWLMDTMRPFYSFSYFLPLLYGPFIWLFIRRWTGKEVLPKKSLIHFLPIILASLTLLVRNVPLPAIYFLYVFFSVKWTMVFELLSLAFYHYLAFTALDKIQEPLPAYRFTYSLSTLSWLRQFIVASFLLCAGIAVMLCVMYFIYPHGQQLRFSFGALTLFIYWISYKAWTQPELFLVIPGGIQYNADTQRKSGLQMVEKKYSNSGLDKNRIVQIIETLKQKLQNEKPYLNPNLRIEDLADSICCSKHHLSQALNEHLDKGFYDYINQFRVEEAKSMLSNPTMDNQKIASIGFDAGFNSVSTFNDVFKKLSGMSPSQFRKQREQVKYQKQRV
jgi:AraC-like DNA-binding protein